MFGDADTDRGVEHGQGAGDGANGSAETALELSTREPSRCSSTAEDSTLPTDPLPFPVVEQAIGILPVAATADGAAACMGVAIGFLRPSRSLSRWQPRG